MKPTIEDVRVVLEKFDASDWDELRIEAADFRLHVYKTAQGERPTRAPTSPVQAPEPVPAPAVQPPATTPSAQPSQTAAVAPPPSPTGSTTNRVVVRAPSLGTFYRSPKPGAPPFVEVGQAVEAGSQVCLLEVMKLFTAVQAGVDGVVVEILVGDGGLVEHDQPLMVIATPGG